MAEAMVLIFSSEIVLPWSVRSTTSLIRARCNGAMMSPAIPGALRISSRRSTFRPAVSGFGSSSMDDGYALNTKFRNCVQCVGMVLQRR